MGVIYCAFLGVLIILSPPQNTKEVDLKMLRNILIVVFLATFVMCQDPNIYNCAEEWMGYDICERKANMKFGKEKSCPNLKAAVEECASKFNENCVEFGMTRIKVQEMHGGPKEGEKKAEVDEYHMRDARMEQIMKQRCPDYKEGDAGSDQAGDKTNVPGGSDSNKVSMYLTTIMLVFLYNYV